MDICDQVNLQKHDARIQVIHSINFGKPKQLFKERSILSVNFPVFLALLEAMLVCSLEFQSWISSFLENGL